VRKIQVGKRTEILGRSNIISMTAFLGRIESADMDFFPIYHDSDPPFAVSLVPTNSTESTCVVTLNSSVGLILRRRTLSYIFSAIVERIMISVVRLFTFGTSEYLPMHRYEKMIGSCPHCIEALRQRIPVCNPIPLRKPLEICSIHDGILILCQRDKAVRFIKRLSDCVAFHTVFHIPTSNGSLTSAAILA